MPSEWAFPSTHRQKGQNSDGQEFAKCDELHQLQHDFQKGLLRRLKLYSYPSELADRMLFGWA